MKVIHTLTGVLAIVGLGYLAGVGQAFLRDRPVILGDVGAPSKPDKANESSADTQPPTDNGTISQPQTIPQAQDDPVADDPISIDAPTSPPAVSTDEELTGEDEFNARLDAPVPDGMLTLRQAHQMWLDGAYFIDSRLRHQYDEGHVSLAAYLTAGTFFSDEGKAEMQTIPPDAPVVIYCVGGEECDASKNTKALLEQFGYTDLWIMGVGYDEWAAAGLPTSLTQEDAQTGTEEGAP